MVVGTLEQLFDLHRVGFLLMRTPEIDYGSAEGLYTQFCSNAHLKKNFIKKLKLELEPDDYAVVVVPIECLVAG